MIYSTQDTRREASLVLEDGSKYSGYSFGAPVSGAGEVVFTTGMTGYPQSLSDPSFRGQILVGTYPLQGNYGVPMETAPGKEGPACRPRFDASGIPLDFESDRIQVSGFVVSEACLEPSHHASRISLSDWLRLSGVPGIYGIDTRALTEVLRERGVMMGKIVVEDSDDVSIESGFIAHPVAEVSPKEVISIENPSPAKVKGGRPLRIALIDCGAKANIYRCLLARGVDVICLPWDHNLNGIDYDGLFLSNGPGDPKACNKTIATVRKAFGKGKPVFGICLGNQIMALAAGADTYKLPYGHRGQNQPCVEVQSGRCYITSQNHGYAVRAETLPRGWEAWFVNNNDDTVEGIRSTRAPFSAVQFHPEGCPGPRDTEFLIDRFLDQVKEALV
jgi:carbamoyl-phosphate synthase small subunit